MKLRFIFLMLGLILGSELFAAQAPPSISSTSQQETVEQKSLSEGQQLKWWQFRKRSQGSGKWTGNVAFIGALLGSSLLYVVLLASLSSALVFISLGILGIAAILSLVTLVREEGNEKTGQRRLATWGLLISGAVLTFFAFLIGPGFFE